MKKLVNGVEVDMTMDEIAEYNQRQADWDAQFAERLTKECQTALETYIDTIAGLKSYSSGISCASYKDSTNAQWAAEATAFIAWRDECYVYAYDYLARAQAGEIENPSVDDFMTGVPAMVWPEPSPEE